jgi:hypothetical protein
MNKKLLALGLVGAAAWLFKTQKGAEVRKQLGEQAGKLTDKAKDLYSQAREKAPESFQAS